MGKEPSVTDSASDVGSWCANKKRKMVKSIVTGQQHSVSSVDITWFQSLPHEPSTEAGTVPQSNACKRELTRGVGREGGKGFLRFHICGDHVNEMDKAKYGQMRMVWQCALSGK